MNIQYLIFKEESRDGIDDYTLVDVVKQIKDKKGDVLYFIVQSNGGEPYASMKIMNMLQNRFAKIISIVPNQAMSAATLMTLGTDEIYMDDESALGPLDLPIEHPKDGSNISALDVQNTITTISSLSDSIAKNMFSFLRDKNSKKLSIGDAAKLSLQTATEFVKPIVQQIDPYHLQKAYRELNIGLTCAYKLLLTRMMKGNFIQARNTARDLVNDYPSHNHAINLAEAKNILNLTIKHLNTLDVWANLKTEFDKISGKSYHIKYGEISLTPKGKAK